MANKRKWKILAKAHRVEAGDDMEKIKSDHGRCCVKPRATSLALNLSTERLILFLLPP